MEVVLLVIELIVAMALIITVLLQRSEGGALGIGGGGGMSGFMTGRATANLLTRATAVLAALFMATSLSLAVMSSNRSKAPSSIVGESDKPPVSAPKAPAKPAGPSAPVR